MQQQALEPFPSDTLLHQQARPSDTVVYNIGGNARVHLGDNYAPSRQWSESKVYDKGTFLSSLTYPYMNTRKQQISNAFPDTYDWIFQPPHQTNHGHQAWDCFGSWFQQPPQTQEDRPYWIHGKPGSGKSTMMKFLDSRLSMSEQTTEMAGGRPVLIASYFFWSSGTPMQRSLEGMCRSLLFQFLEQQSQFASSVWSQCRLLELSEDPKVENRKGLCEILATTLESLQQQNIVVLLIDGLDECGEALDEQDELLELLETLSDLAIKTIVSSRPENMFRDAFAACPSLRLEDLTRMDIERYVSFQLGKVHRWMMLAKGEPVGCRALMNNIVHRAEGVFLWVVLVVRGIIRSLRDGDDVCQIQLQLSTIPSDLDSYFKPIIQSIEPDHRREASVLLQLVLYEEHRFNRAVGVLLVDTLFVSEPDDQFILRPDFNFYGIDLDHQISMRNKLAAAYRKVNGRCKGLLQCISNADTSDDPLLTSQLANQTLGYKDEDNTEYPRLKTATEIEAFMCCISVVFLHRSLRDFLMLPEQQQLLHSYTGGQPIDPRRHLYNSRIVQLLALDRINQLNSRLARRTASGILVALSVDEEDPHAIERAMLVRDCIERVGSAMEHFEPERFYLDASLQYWHVWKSNFLTLAIEFKLVSYVYHSLTETAIQTKRGRPVLDYILRPRASDRSPNSPTYSVVNPELVHCALVHGADPNELFCDTSVWALFLCILADAVAAMRLWKRRGGSESRQYGEYLERWIVPSYETLRIMIEAGAALRIPAQWLSSPKLGMSEPLLDWEFKHRWPEYVRASPRKFLFVDDDSIVRIEELFSDFETLKLTQVTELTELVHRKRAERGETMGNDT